MIALRIPTEWQGARPVSERRDRALSGPERPDYAVPSRLSASRTLSGSLVGQKGGRESRRKPA
ncbi:hypothetical protein GCM10017600_62690 [Streptosporangium carneum]|uniref:Uncharacterized protein n=1 Tax=Streptosporangium carneum TaxID=47481 RepID=A0A9W6I8F7_9ACTN|nr:hypothetical protein GCM10017600_62690 [Streptosporangium carneum]